jgi:hypothetical protein
VFPSGDNVEVSRRHPRLRARLRAAAEEVFDDELAQQPGEVRVELRDPRKKPSICSVSFLKFISRHSSSERAVREAAARGLSVSEATGMFRAAALRLQAHASERGVTEAPDDQDDPEPSAPASPSSEGQPG